jgi:hypothetical protein
MIHRRVGVLALEVTVIKEAQVLDPLCFPCLCSSLFVPVLLPVVLLPLACPFPQPCLCPGPCPCLGPLLLQSISLRRPLSESFAFGKSVSQLVLIPYGQARHDDADAYLSPSDRAAAAGGSA